MKPGADQSRSLESGRTTRNELDTTSSIVSLGGYVSVPDVEHRLADCHTFATDSGVAYVDLVEAVEFDVVALIVLLSAIVRRQSSGKETKFRLPRDPLARHTLRLWRFPRAVKAVTGIPFRMLVESGDLKYFGEKWPQLRVRGYATSARASVLGYLVEQQHFGLSPHRIDGEQSLAYMMDSEANRWRTYALVQLLDKVLYGQATDVGRVVLQELLANVVEHPEPSVAIVASQLDLVAHIDEDVPAVLTISVWDDGLSIVETLRTRLRAGGHVRSDRPASLDTFTVEAQSWSPRSTVYSSDWTPDTTAQDPEILLASLFPGITRKAEFQKGSKRPNSADTSMDFGFGLFALYKTVLDNFRGSVEVRCEQMTLQLKGLDERGKYQVRVVADENQQRLLGTIVTARLPVHDA